MIEVREQLLEFIEKHPGVSTVEIIDKFSDINPWELLETLDELKEFGMIE